MSDVVEKDIEINPAAEEKHKENKLDAQNHPASETSDPGNSETFDGHLNNPEEAKTKEAAASDQMNNPTDQEEDKYKDFKYMDAEENDAIESGLVQNFFD